MPQPLKDFIESTEKEFDELFGYEIREARKEFANYLADEKDILAFIQERTIQAYELGKQETLAMVMREIEEIQEKVRETKLPIYEGMKAEQRVINEWRNAEISHFLFLLSTLKQKLSTNIK